MKLTRKLLLGLITLCILQACAQTSLVDEIDNPSVRESTTSYEQHRILGLTEDPRLREISGIVASRENPGFFWVHNDSGDDPRVYLVDSTLSIVLTAHLNMALYNEPITLEDGTYSTLAHIQPVKHVDWEDIAVITEDGVSSLVIADIGDNRAQRRNVQLYKLTEPEYTGSSSISVNVEKMVIHYTEGPRDAEALAFDPISNELVILTKRDVISRIYSFSFEPTFKRITSVGTLDLRKHLPDDGHTNKITGMDINQRGEILIKNYSHVVLFLNESSLAARNSIQEKIPVETNYIVEPQGESICWGLDQASYFTVSENRYGKPEGMYKYY